MACTVASFGEAVFGKQSYGGARYGDVRFGKISYGISFWVIVGAVYALAFTLCFRKERRISHGD